VSVHEDFKTMGSSWRFAGIDDDDEIERWRAVGVFDPQRAGLLRAVGVTPADMAALPEIGGRPVGVAFALGEITLGAVCAAIEANGADRENTGVRRRRALPQGSG
jgi:hypothetical protein